MTKKTKGKSQEEEKQEKEKLEKGKQMLRDTDLPVAEIARKTGANLDNLYYHSSRIRKKDDVKQSADNNKNDKLLEKYEEDRQKWKKEKEELQGKIKDLETIINNHAEMLKEEKKHSDKALKDAEYNISNLKKTNKELANRIDQLIESHQDDMEFAKKLEKINKAELKKEKEMHGLLLKYFVNSHEMAQT